MSRDTSRTSTATSFHQLAQAAAIDIGTFLRFKTMWVRFCEMRLLIFGPHHETGHYAGVPHPQQSWRESWLARRVTSRLRHFTA